MLFKVTKTFFFYLMWYTSLVVSFGISLYVIFGSSNNNADPASLGSSNNSSDTVSLGRSNNSSDYVSLGSSNNCSDPDYFDYSDFRKVILKVIVMITGEIDFSEIPLNYEPDSHFNYVVEFMLLTFFLRVTVVILMNLLNGLAVSDTKEIKDDSELIGNQSVLEVISFWETFCWATLMMMVGV
eukprot:TRINITY_DN5994_c1_g2_i1.p1 TRINITY_DN5994_c1_g2~~TRINITY_DN5994_c1_g2_i1.p1  ORF type:complete len:183 (-),score=11.63 TRINITY_DN5994_c1_g2_i1:280-828(-)